MKNLKTLFVLLAVICLASCGVNGNSGSKLQNPPKHVILIGFDGLSSYCINNGADMPVFRKLMAEGASTVENRSVLPSSSAVNWASMFMGAGPEIHGYTEWGSRTPELPSRVLTENGKFPDIYYQLRKKMPEAELGFIYEWEGMRYLVDTLSVNYITAAGLSSADTQSAVASTVDYIKTKKPAFCSVIFAEPDGAGHTHGWESEQYFTTVAHLDKALGEIVKAVEEAGMMDETVIVLAADHGGINTGHGGKTMKEMQTTIVLYGKGVKKGYKIPECTMVYDIASTIGYMFGIEQPQVWIGRPVTSAFE